MPHIKAQLILLLACMVIGCEANEETFDPRLEGKWYSNKALTIEKSDLSKMDSEKQTFLHNNLGDLGYVSLLSG